MEHWTNIQNKITANIHQSNLPKFSISLDLTPRPNSSALNVDRSLISMDNLYSSNKHIGQSFSGFDNISITDRKYSDPEFLPIPESITQDNERTSLDDLQYGTYVTRWLRPEQIRWSKEAQQYSLSVFNQPHSKDINQGRLGDCWFVSALSLIAEIPQILYKVMITKQYNPVGLYKIRLCNRGIWQVVTIDDMLPVTETNSLVFTRSQKKQLFASLIEKALAKLHGSYKALESGRCVEGLQTLTGKPCEVFLLHLTDPKKKPNLNHIWTKIIQSKAKGYLMTCLASNNQLNGELFHRMGLELDHAYSIIDARQVGSQRLVRLRNPWGKKELNTSLSDKWPRILNEKFVTSSNNDGVFWMSLEEISSLFSEVTICKISGNEHEVRKTGQFSDFSSKITSAYSLHCPNGGEIDIELFNATDAKYNNRLTNFDIDLFLIVLSSNGSCQAYKHSLDYYTTLSTTVPPGRYIILAGSMSAINYSICSKYTLVVHGDQPFVVNEQPSSYELVCNAFHAVALRANNRKDFEDGVSILTFNDNGGFGFICENKSNRTIRFTTDFQGSINVVSSRKTFHMVDVIPAKTKQLFAFFTRKMLSEDVNIVYQVEYQDVNHIGARNNPPIPSAALGLHRLKSVH
ncbi:unnamed protein product [Rotaria magnacalcarata]|uniref:Calpain catalytic domain-containing protein n=1 Tax=Rotaria magnacalcarata TaxID=392030 RepID=A0A819JBV2_9BILA|nr:unnamed protein product [Rotaria magnacalcarata]